MNLIMVDVVGKPLWMWLTFAIAIFGLFAFDLGILHREDRQFRGKRLSNPAGDAE